MGALMRRALGSTGLEVSLLGLGTVKLGRNTDIKYPSPFDLPDEAAVRVLLERARELGINLIDTAPAYGDSEARLGRLLPGTREDWVICTKTGETYEDGRSTYDFTPEAVARSTQQSLSRLRCEYLDVVLIHSNGDDEAILKRYGTVDALLAQKRAGYVRAVGLSSKSAKGVDLALAAGVDVIMATAHLEYTDELDAIARAGDAGCGVLVKKAFASGYATSESLRFVARQPGISSIVVGTINPDHLSANVAAVSV